MRLIELTVVLAVSISLAPTCRRGAANWEVVRIGYRAKDLAAASSTTEAFRRGRRDLGYAQGRDIAIEYRDAEGKAERLPALAAELATHQATSS